MLLPNDESGRIFTPFMLGSSEHLPAEFHYPPLIPKERHQHNVDKTFHHAHNRIRTGLIEMFPKKMKRIRRCPTEHMVLRIEEPDPIGLNAKLGTDKAFLIAGALLKRGNEFDSLLLPQQVTAEIINTIDPKYRILLARTLFWSCIFEMVDEMENFAEEAENDNDGDEDEEDNDVDDEFDLFEGLPYAEIETEFLASGVELLDAECAEEDEDDPMSRLDIRTCVERCSWLKAIYYSILEGSLNHNAAAGNEG